MKNKIMLAILITIFLATSVYAFGISSPFWKTNPLVMYPGQTITADLNLQNNVGDEDVTAKIQVIEGADIVKLEKDTYTVKARTTDTMVPITVSIPREATENRHVKIEIVTVTSGEGGMVAMGTGMKVEFDVILTNVPEKVQKQEKILLWGGIGAAIIVLLAIIFFLARRKPKQVERMQETKTVIRKRSRRKHR
ncbi:MAG: hypothetical protein KJ767_02590 [Nanoarchaeota archaeon]|nr:hypothetical protein [Nanoarchaeota archaeon]